MKIVLLGVFLVFLNFEKNKEEDHALYISVIQIQQIAEKSPVQINIKVFTDDLQSALRNEFSDYSPVLEEILCQEKRVFISAYFSKHLTIQINEKNCHLTLMDCQKEGEVYWLKFEMENSEKWEKLKVKADFFMELFPTQSNIVNVAYGGEKRYARITKNDIFCETTF
jgi:hypothetical protein